MQHHLLKIIIKEINRIRQKKGECRPKRELLCHRIDQLQVKMVWKDCKTDILVVEREQSFKRINFLFWNKNPTIALKKVGV